ncbi:hypothetical protein FRC12_025003 [Ceratobasidium sp. 428]|nr:hypothetical protein FRC12_025003 [Ceratobasidium sp. 428]
MGIKKIASIFCLRKTSVLFVTVRLAPCGIFRIPLRVHAEQQSDGTYVVDASIFWKALLPYIQELPAYSGFMLVSPNTEDLLGVRTEWGWERSMGPYLNLGRQPRLKFVNLSAQVQHATSRSPEYSSAPSSLCS